MRGPFGRRNVEKEEQLCCSDLKPRGKHTHTNEIKVGVNATLRWRNYEAILFDALLITEGAPQHPATVVQYRCLHALFPMGFKTIPTTFSGSQLLHLEWSVLRVPQTSRPSLFKVLGFGGLPVQKTNWEESWAIWDDFPHRDNGKCYFCHLPLAQNHKSYHLCASMMLKRLLKSNVLIGCGF